MSINIVSFKNVGFKENVVLKVSDLLEFSVSELPFSKQILDARGLDSDNIRNILHLPWGGIISKYNNFPHAGLPVAVCEDDININPGDIIEVNPYSSKFYLRYRRGDNGNILFTTERCNSYCLMCSQPPKNIDDFWRVKQLHEIIDLIDKDEESLAISGGEPTLLKNDLVALVKKCADVLPDTHLHILSNGRLIDKNYASNFDKLHPSLTWGIPLYSDISNIHDFIVQSKGAFKETIRGIYALQKANQRVEVRIVILKSNIDRFINFSKYIYYNMPFVEHVAFMGLEPIGFAKANKDELLIDIFEVSSLLEESVLFLDKRGINVSIYNIPLCVLPRSIWNFARKSISNWKQNYLAECSGCLLKSECAGFFSWSSPQWTSQHISPIMIEVDHE